MLRKCIELLGVLLVLSISFTPAFALTELERTTINDPRLQQWGFGGTILENVNVNQQIQISADIKNNQEKSQNFVYLVQIKNEMDFVILVGWISGQLTPNQEFSAALSWVPDEPGEFTAEIYVWEGLINHKALTEYTMLQISVS